MRQGAHIFDANNARPPTTADFLHGAGLATSSTTLLAFLSWAATRRDRAGIGTTNVPRRVRREVGRFLKRHGEEIELAAQHHLNPRTKGATSPLTTRSPARFFAVVFALAAPLWGIAAVADRGLVSKGGTDLPLSALTFVCPLLAALLLVYRREGPEAARVFLGRIIHVERVRPRSWYVPTVVLLPLLYASSYMVLRAMGEPLPAPQTSAPTLLALFAFFLFSAACEEAGWMGYAIDPLQARRSALTASLLLGVVWAAIHIVPDLQAGHTWRWIAGQRSFSVALRVLIVWLYNNSGKSVHMPILFHALDNVSVYSLFPHDGGGHYDPAVTAVLTTITAGIVTFLWGRQTLSRFRFERGGRGSR